MKPARGSAARRRPAPARGGGPRLVSGGAAGALVEPGGLHADMRPRRIDLRAARASVWRLGAAQILGFTNRPGAPSAQRALDDPMPADFPLDRAEASGGRRRGCCGVGHGGAPAGGTNGGSIASLLEYRNNILTFLFYTTLTAAQTQRPVASAPADGAASLAVVATGAPNVNSPPSARRADRASFGAERTPAAVAQPRMPARSATGGADPRA